MYVWKFSCKYNLTCHHNFWVKLPWNLIEWCFFFYWIESSNLNVPEVVHFMTWDLAWRFKIYALQLCIFTEIISLVPQLQCVKKGHSVELGSHWEFQEECHSFLSKGVMLEWHSFFKKQIYHWYSFDYIIQCGVSGNLSEQESWCQNGSKVVPRV